MALAQASLSRMIPDIATVIGWHSCDHTGPVFEGDLLSSTHTLIAEQAVAGGRLRAFRTIVRAHRGDDVVDVLDWVPLDLLPLTALHALQRAATRRSHRPL